jgi:quercetin dioxygenase-like cupin family protein
MLQGKVDVVANGDRHTLRPGDVFWTAAGCVHAFYETQAAQVRWLETSAPARRRATRTASSGTGTASPAASPPQARSAA